MIAPDMPKLQSPYLRERVEINGKLHYVVTDKIDPDYLWVFEDPDVFVMEKLDGTNVSVIKKDGLIDSVWNRRNMVSKLVSSYEGTQSGDIEDVYEHNPEFKNIKEGIGKSLNVLRELKDGQHFGEMIGPGIQDNPMDIPHKTWVPFNTFGIDNMVYEDFKPVDFEQISGLMKGLKSKYYKLKHPDVEPNHAEGIIFYRPSTGEMSKLRRDMYDWWITDNPGIVNKHVNTYQKKPSKPQPEGMAKEFSLLGSRKKQGLVTNEEYESSRDEILKKYGIR